MNTDIDPTQITAIILAGGRGSRMGGEDKGFVCLRGKPLVQWVVQRLEPQVQTLVISANRNCDRYREYGYPVVVDHLTGYQGPLAGIAAGLESVRTPYTVVVPVDTPMIPDAMVQKLVIALTSSQVDLAVVEIDKQMQPAHMLFKTSLRDDLEKYLASGGRKLQDWIRQQNYITVEFGEAHDEFLNINDAHLLAQVNTGTIPVTSKKKL